VVRPCRVSPGEPCIRGYGRAARPRFPGPDPGRAGLQRAPFHPPPPPGGGKGAGSRLRHDPIVPDRIARRGRPGPGRPALSRCFRPGSDAMPRTQGEVTPASWVDLFQFCSKHHRCVFFDVGSGYGTLVRESVKSYGCVYGIGVEKYRWDATVSALLLS
jgi:hypothetical protein